MYDFRNEAFRRVGKVIRVRIYLTKLIHFGSFDPEFREYTALPGIGRPHLSLAFPFYAI